MSELLYYEDPYVSVFEASVLERRERKDGRLAVVLDRTAFYPEGGGQPCDLGTLGNATVLHVEKDDGAVVHCVDRDPGDGRLTGRVNWERRFDYMQQHTGQHILSACFLERAGLETVSVHQGESYTTIEFNGEELSPGVEREIEDMANRVIVEGRTVRTYWCEESEVPSLNLRRPPKVSGRIRIVEIDDLDRVACGGVHTASTAEASLVRMLHRERIRGRLRYAFLIGNRAHEHHRESRDVLARVGDLLSVPPSEVEPRVQALESRMRDLEYELNGVKRELAEERAARLAEQAQTIAGSDWRGITKLIDTPAPDDLRAVAEALTRHEDLAFVLGSHTEKGLVWLAGHGKALTMELSCLKQKAFAAIEAKGGGKPPLYQGKGSSAGDWEAFAHGVFSCVRRCEPA